MTRTALSRRTAVGAAATAVPPASAAAVPASAAAVPASAPSAVDPPGHLDAETRAPGRPADGADDTRPGRGLDRCG